MPEIFDYESGKSSINEVQVQELFEKWESVSKKLEEMETDGVYRYLDGTDMFSEGERVLEFYTFYDLCRRYGAGLVSDKVEEEHQYLFI